MAETSTNPQVLLAEDIARFYDDPQGFVMYVFPWGNRVCLSTTTALISGIGDLLLRLGQGTSEAAVADHDLAKVAHPSRLLAGSGRNEF
jgi:hypothetical protein